MLAQAVVASAQISVPVAPSQPDMLSYGVSELSLFKLYDRDSYRAAFGKATPVCDPAKPLKAWFDSTMSAVEPDSLALYKGVLTNKAGDPAIKQFWMTAAEAAAVNLPGREAIPRYIPAPSNAYVQTDKGRTGVSPAVLLTRDQAVMLAVELNGTLQESALGDTVYPPEEPRRQFVLTVDGVAHNAGLLLMERWASGIGMPGHWTKAQGNELSFVPEPPPDCATLTEWRPVPVRDLLSNESLKNSPFGVAIYRTDKQQQQNEAGGQFTPADRLLLQKIAAKLGVQ
jgi:hypothetical protein